MPIVKPKKSLAELKEKQNTEKESKANRIAKLMPPVTGLAIGFDPEVFCTQKNPPGAPAPWMPANKNQVLRVLPGKEFTMGVKGFYETSEHCAAGIGLLADGMAVEVNTEFPAKTGDDFSELVASAYQSIKHHVNAHEGAITSLVSTEVFPEFRTDPAFLEIGCEPDFDVYSGSIVEPINPLSSNFRHAGGHIHVSIKDKLELDPKVMAKAMDIFVGMLLESRSSKENQLRREVVGPGRIRTKGKNYIEYRSPSNRWFIECNGNLSYAIWELTNNAMALARSIADGQKAMPKGEFDFLANVARDNLLAGVGTSAAQSWYTQLLDRDLLTSDSTQHLRNLGYDVGEGGY